MSAAQAYMQYVNSTNASRAEKSGEKKKKIPFKGFGIALWNFISEPAFWDLYSAERSGDPDEMDRYFKKYAS